MSSRRTGPSRSAQKTASPASAATSSRWSPQARAPRPPSASWTPSTTPAVSVERGDGARLLDRRGRPSSRSDGEEPRTLMRVLDRRAGAPVRWDRRTRRCRARARRPGRRCRRGRWRACAAGAGVGLEPARIEDARLRTVERVEDPVDAGVGVGGGERDLDADRRVLIAGARDRRCRRRRCRRERSRKKLLARSPCRSPSRPPLTDERRRGAVAENGYDGGVDVAARRSSRLPRCGHVDRARGVEVERR